ncbi:DsbA family protein (plasmid) [Rhodococcus opacus]|uniref:DsbA family protein n=1 Tax=Rhodococcus opacus TaxID=37919 RepID=UPI001FF123BE|nr:thioredoxin domain-containing protein [Rhodococcus opacus]UOT08548.1 DsbA family protein [Rhodococcus opacus]
MTRGLRLSVALVVAFVVVVAAILLAGRSGPDPAAGTQTADPAATAARADSHRLSTAPAGGVTFVEFLDFECEACRSVYPAIEQLRAEYGDRVSFVVRYFPLPGHFNAERAARAVEAAAQQGRFEQMYQRMYETQTEWGEQRTPKDEVFRGFAADLGLDLAAFDAAYTAPATLDRINADVADGETLGVQGTPTFFLDGQRLDPTSYQDLTDALDAALR